MFPAAHAVPEPRVRVALKYSEEPSEGAWELPEVPVPESVFHDETVAYLKALLERWVAVGGRDALVGRNLAVRWMEARPNVGVDPDVCLIEPAPPEGKRLQSLRLWEPGHVTPRLAVEVVSRRHPYKDYSRVQEKYAALGVEELWVVDPERVGPGAAGEAMGLQVWRKMASGLERVYAGEGPVRSVAVGAWVGVTQDGGVLVSEDREGEQRWLTAAEAERAAKETERAAKETERAAKETERAAKETERAAKETERAAKETERAAKERALEAERTEHAAKETERTAKEAALRRVAELEAQIALS